VRHAVTRPQRQPAAGAECAAAQQSANTTVCSASPTPPAGLPLWEVVSDRRPCVPLAAASAKGMLQFSELIPGSGQPHPGRAPSELVQRRG